jgi:ribosomal protein S18 acetylase RimI-like enzyme
VDVTLKQAVGYLWVGIADRDDGPYAYIYDFVILEPFRRRGYGKTTLRALEEAARGMGARMIAAHVYNENSVARALYDQIGYTVDQVALTKVVD